MPSISSAAQWGVLFAIHTGPGGPGSFSQWIVTPRGKGGSLPNGFVVSDGAVWQDDSEGNPTGWPVSMETEEVFFDFLKIDWMEPQKRVPKWRRSQG